MVLPAVNNSSPTEGHINETAEAAQWPFLLHMFHKSEGALGHFEVWKPQKVGGGTKSALGNAICAT